MQLTDLNVVIAIVSGVLGIYAGYKKALKEAQDQGESNAVIITMLKHHEELLTKLDTKLEDSAKARHVIKEKIAAHDEQIKTLFNDIEEIKSNCKDCRKKCD